MSLLETLSIALGSLSINKGRTVLTSLGITIGIAAVIAMVSAGYGAKSLINDSFDKLGPNIVFARSGTVTGNGIRTNIEPAFSVSDKEAILEELPELVKSASMVNTVPIPARNESGTEYFTTIAGGDPTVFAIRNWRLDSYENNRFYNEEDFRRNALVAVIGQKVVRELYPNVNPIGKYVRCGSHKFRIVGVLAEKGTAPNGNDQDDVIMVPNSTLQKRIMGEEKSLILLVEAKTPELANEVKERVQTILKRTHKIKEDKEPPFTVNSMQQYLDFVLIFTDTLTYLIYAIAAISLIVGGIGVMNIMLVSVTERTREIGIRMAIGARTSDVLNQFLTEAIILALVGGFCGIAIGLSCALIIAIVVQWQFIISMESILIAVVVSTLVGIFFGYYPARKASLLDPIEALRFE